MSARKGTPRNPTTWEIMRGRAREMRHKPTPAEDYLWQYIRARQLDGAKFRRQHVIEIFIADFYCAEAGLIVEVDGAGHDADYDAERTTLLNELGLRVIRFSNAEVMTHLPRVLDTIRRALHDDTAP